MVRPLNLVSPLGWARLPARELMAPERLLLTAFHRRAIENADRDGREVDGALWRWRRRMVAIAPPRLLSVEALFVGGELMHTALHGAPGAAARSRVRAVLFDRATDWLGGMRAAEGWCADHDPPLVRALLDAKAAVIPDEPYLDPRRCRCDRRGGPVELDPEDFPLRPRDRSSPRSPP